MKNLTEENPYKLILLFMLPVFFGNVLQQLYNIVDSIIVGNTINADALSGVGSTTYVVNLVIGFADGLAAGLCIRTARKFGAGDMDGVRRVIGLTIVLCAAVSILLTGIALPLTKPILRIMKTNETYFDYAYYYLFTVFCGIGATMLYNMVAGMLRAVGDSVTPLVALAGSSILNIGLDFAFIVGCDMQYIGAGLATVLSQLISGGVSLIYMFLHYPALRPKKKDFAWDWHTVGNLLAYGIPLAFQNCIISMGTIIQQTALNGLEPTMRGVVTAHSVATKINHLPLQIEVAVGSAITSFAGQNAGAGKYERVRQGVRIGILYSTIGWILCVAFCMGLGKPLIGLFLNKNRGGEIISYYDDIVAYAMKYMFWQCSFDLLNGVLRVFRQTLQGLGKNLLSMVGGVVELAGRILASLLFVKWWGFTGLCISNPTAWSLGALFVVITYCIVMHKIIKKQKNRTKDAAAGNGETLRETGTDVT